MNTTTTNNQTKEPQSARRKVLGSGSTWKSAIVATCLSGVLLGWAILGRMDASTTAELTTATTVQSNTVQSITGVETSAQLSTVTGSAGSSPILLPTMPQRPVFQQPVTRTRRS